jgi:phosphoadenosine phosphosulfate reductase
MTEFEGVRAACEGLSTEALLRYLIKEHYAGETVVTASLRAPSIVVLKLVADIDPATPVVFCRPGELFVESETFRKEICTRLGLTNTRETEGAKSGVLPDAADHYERMWAEYKGGLGHVHELVHLNDVMVHYDCWISAVYHLPAPQTALRVDIEGRLIRVNPLLDWSPQDIRAFMREHDLPFHPRAGKRVDARLPEDTPCPPTYHF